MNRSVRKSVVIDFLEYLKSDYSGYCRNNPKFLRTLNTAIKKFGEM